MHSHFAAFALLLRCEEQRGNYNCVVDQQIGRRTRSMVRKSDAKCRNVLVHAQLVGQTQGLLLSRSIDFLSLNTLALSLLHVRSCIPRQIVDECD